MDTLIRLQHINKGLTPLRSKLLNHPIYLEFDRMDSLRLFVLCALFKSDLLLRRVLFGQFSPVPRSSMARMTLPSEGKRSVGAYST